jgi:hypothetical protein
MPTKTSLRFRLFAAGLWLLTTGAAFAQEALEITVRLTPAEVAEIARLIDLQPISISPPPAYWDLQTGIARQLEADPAALRAVLSARSAAR